MSFTTEPMLSAENVVRLSRPPRAGRLLGSLPPPPAEQPALLDWALAVADTAERRVAELEARIAYLESLAVTDELTGALNRRGFLMEFSRAVAAARRGGPQGVVILFDLDGFKSVNDSLGHAIGDEVLRRVGTLLRRRVRKMDVAARLGGDEFAVLLIGAGLAGAQRKAEALAQSIAAIAAAIDASSLALSASYGLAAFDGTEDEDMVLHRADLAMYAEKRRRFESGRRTGT